MIPFVDNLRKTDEESLILINFEDSFWNKFITLRVIFGMIATAALSIYQLIILPFIFFFSILDAILEIIKFIIYIPIKISRKLMFKKSLNDYINSLDQQGNLVLQYYVHPDKQSLNSFIVQFLRSHRNQYNTVDTNGNFVCDKHRRRSAGDIYRICKTYYPHCTFEDVMKILIQNCIDVNIGASRCSTIHKFVFHCDSYHFEPKGSVEYVPHTKFKDIMKYYGFK